MEHLPQTEKGAVILLPKHQSTWETFFFPMLMSHPLAYVFKRELLYIPFFGWAIGRCDMIHIDRRKRTEAWNLVAEQGKRLSAQGIWVIMFPEGTRIPRGQAGDYKSGGTRLSIATGVPVVPIAVTSARCWPRKSFLIRPGVVDVSIGAPISPEGREPAEMMKEVSAWIETENAAAGPRRLQPLNHGRQAPRPLLNGNQLSLFDADTEPAAVAPSGENASRRELLLGLHRVGYELRRARRRSIGFVVGLDGLRVSAPRWVPIAEIERARCSKGRLDPAQARGAARARPPRAGRAHRVAERRPAALPG